MNEDEVYAAIAAGIANQARPDDAPTCDEPGCNRLGVIVATVVWASGATQVWHWCVWHDPEDVPPLIG